MQQEQANVQQRTAEVNQQIQIIVNRALQEIPISDLYAIVTNVQHTVEVLYDMELVAHIQRNAQAQQQQAQQPQQSQPTQE